MSEEARKTRIAEMTAGLRCRCPGFSTLTQVQCKGVGGQKLCFFECKTPEGLFQSFPVGAPGLCRCQLGTRSVEDSLVVHTDPDGLEWGHAQCVDTGESLQDFVTDAAKRRRTEQMWGLGAAAVLIAGTFWFAGRA